MPVLGRRYVINSRETRAGLLRKSAWAKRLDELSNQRDLRFRPNADDYPARKLEFKKAKEIGPAGLRFDKLKGRC